MNVLPILTGSPAAGGQVLRAWLIGWLGVSWILIHLYSGFYGSPNAMLFRTLHLGVALALVFLYIPTGGKRSPQPLPFLLLDTIFIIGSLWTSVYFVIEYDTWELRRTDMRLIDYATGILAIILTLETSRRAFGMSMVWVCLFFLFHALFSNYFPPPFNGPPASIFRLIRSIFLGDDGIYGVAVAVMSQFVVLFILFGTLLTLTGGGAFFTRMAFSLFGHRTGGPAKAAVVSSGFLGMLSGSSVSNVATVGPFTIPLMRRLGYGNSFAGGVEAAASNGGPIMPPVMGAIAFMMAEFLHVSYAKVALAAAIPAVLYYLVIYVTVHFEAKKLGLRALDKAALPSAWLIMKRQGYLLIPLAMIIITLMLGYSIVFVAVIIIGTTFLIGLLQKSHRMTPYRLLDSFERTVQSVVGLCASAGAAGVIIGAVFATGLTFTVTQFTVDLAGGHTWVVLVFAGMMSFIMGLGMPPTAIYITLVATVIPVLVKSGISPMAAHLFAFYWGNAANITPPVAISAYVAAPIANASPDATGWQATRLGAGTFLLPFLFVYAPGMLFEGPWYDTVYVTLAAALGLSAFALSLTGYCFAPMPIWQRLTFLASSLLLIVPDVIPNAFGYALLAGGIGSNWLTARSEAAAPGRSPIASDELQPSIATAPTASRTALGRLRDRLVAARLKRELGDAPIAVSVVNPRNLTDALMRDAETLGGPEDVTARTLWLSWGVVAVAGIAMEVMGQTYFHATNPLTWVVAIGAIAAFSLFGVARVWAAGRIGPAAATDHSLIRVMDAS
ncbi:MAG: TRAP transporter fused permease subunit [Alphaproteobacteria bacterium]|nr:TRAP transporter fused permease subunit [Alphaproteobacteria bacterium]